MRVGCSGWHYKSWRGRFYPEGLPPSRWLEAYAKVFDCVEINNSFYRLPEPSMFAEWGDRTPATFLFAVKASRYLTHMLRLTKPAEPLARLLGRAASLGSHLGPLLYQLPPRWPPDASRLESFLEALPRSVLIGRRSRRLHHVIEFRDERCYTPETFRLLERYDVSMCVHDMAGSASPRVVVGPILYVRFHGYGQRYGGRYAESVLTGWSQWLRSAGADREAYAFFNNDIDGHAVHNARTLRRMLGQ